MCQGNSCLMMVIEPQGCFTAGGANITKWSLCYCLLWLFYCQISNTNLFCSSFSDWTLDFLKNSQFFDNPKFRREMLSNLSGGLRTQITFGTPSMAAWCCQRISFGILIIIRVSNMLHNLPVWPLWGLPWFLGPQDEKDLKDKAANPSLKAIWLFNLLW